MFSWPDPELQQYDEHYLNEPSSRKRWMMAVSVGLIRTLFVYMDCCRVTIMDSLLSERVCLVVGWFLACCWLLLAAAVCCCMLLACSVDSTYIDVGCGFYFFFHQQEQQEATHKLPAVRRYNSHPFPGLNVAEWYENTEYKGVGFVFRTRQKDTDMQKGAQGSDQLFCYWVFDKKNICTYIK